MQKIIFFSMAILCSTFGLVAQTQIGTIKGTIDYFGGTLPNVLVRADSYLKAPTVMSRTDSKGNYELSLPVGDYHLSFFLEGYIEKKIDKLTVKANETTVLNQTLHPIMELVPDESSMGADLNAAKATPRATMNRHIPESTMPAMAEPGIDYFDSSSPVRESPPPPPAARDIPIKEESTRIEVVPMDASDLYKKNTLSEARIKYGSKKATEPSVVAQKTPLPKAGQLTAGEINDFAKWKLWKDIDQTDLASYQNYWNIRPTDRYSVQLRTQESGTAIVDAQVQLIDKITNKVVWETRSDNTGKAELWDNLFATTTSSNKEYTIKVIYKNKEYSISKAKAFKDGMNHLAIPVKCDQPDVVDISLVIDLTSSMGDELQYLQSEWSDVMERIQKDHKDLSLRLSCVGYRDHGDEFVVRQSDFSRNFKQQIKFLQEQTAAGGGDVPEAVDEALEVAIDSLSWSSNARAKLLFIVLDAAPHNELENQQRWQRAVQIAARKGIRIVPLACSGIKKDFEYLMRSMALATGGTYTFLTNHSGIGNPHIEPTTDKYEVEYLNDMLVRLTNQFINMPACEPTGIVADQPQNVEINLPQLTQNGDSSANNTTQTAQSFIRCYPNPTMGSVRIEVSEDIDELFLADINGRLLERYDMENNKNQQVDISQYPAGMYLFTYYIDEKAYTGKILLFH